jgi:hypothetical protein
MMVLRGFFLGGKMHITLKKIWNWLGFGLLGWIMVYVLWAGLNWIWYVDIKGYALASPSMHVSQQPQLVLVGDDIREQVACQFDEPLKYINLIMHYYDDPVELNLDWNTYGDPEEKGEEVWGWSDCVWQPEESWAACDIYVVKPSYVHADMNIDTAGHELTHATCGDYHD